MTGQEAATLRTRLGYTQGALAALLQVSTPTVSRREADREVPAEYAARLQGLPPAPPTTTGRGAYRREPEKPAQRRQPPPLPAKRKPAARAQPVPAASAPLMRAEVPVLDADAAGAVLLEGAALGAYWLRVVAARQLVLARRRQRLREEGGAPCR